MSSDRPLLLSLRPRHAEAIVSGRKSVELRRRRIAAPPGTSVILYASAPVKAIVGTARLVSCEVTSADAAWQAHSVGLAVDREEFEAYLDGRQACLLLLIDVQRLHRPLTLKQLRQDQPFQPPQSYRFVSSRDPLAIRELAFDALAPAVPEANSGVDSNAAVTERVA